MNEMLRKQIWRKLEALPEDKVYAVSDYIDFLQSEYGEAAGDARGFRRFAELFQRQARRSGIPATALRESMRVIGATDRVLDAFREAGKEFLAELEQDRPVSAAPDREPPRRREVVVE